MNDQNLAYLLDRLHQHPDWKYQIEVKTWQTDFLRFYQSQTNYNISKQNTSLDVSIYQAKRSFSFSIDQPIRESIDAALNNAESVIGILPEDPDFVDVETDLTKSTEKVKKNNIEAVPLEKKISLLTDLAARADALGFDLFGTFICNYQTHKTINSNHLDKFSTSSPIYFEVKSVKRSNQVTVLETFGGENFDLYDHEDFATRLTAKMRFAQGDIVDVEPGEYTVILAPRCIAEYMQYLSGGMSAYSLDQKSSCFEGKQDTAVFPATITITDDPSDERLITFDYNSDGHIYKKLSLVEKGVFKNFMCNNYFSHKIGLPKNGNSGSCLVLAEGNVSLEEMLKSVENGLYISSLHYMNWINVKETSVTGLTRDGTFMIQNGEITNVVNSLRFTEKITRIFENILELEDKSYTIPFSGNYEFFGIESSRVPHVLVKNFNITSSTKTI